MPGASNAAMRKITETIKKWRIHRSTAERLLDFARRYNAIVRGWIGYYGKFWSRNFNYRLWSAMQSRLLKWMQSKYRLSNRKAQRKLTLVRKEYPKLFVHWYLLRASNEWSRAVWRESVTYGSMSSRGVKFSPADSTRRFLQRWRTAEKGSLFYGNLEPIPRW